MELECAVQNYSWGCRGAGSIVAQLHQFEGAFQIEAEKPYAEFWMGTHENGPSSIKSTGQSLAEIIGKDAKKYLGDEVVAKFGPNLPYLFKVLAVNEALSIQAHPNKKHAEQLFATKPQTYKDPNHKPELAVALGPFQAMCGFRPIEEIQMFFREITGLQAIFGRDNIDSILKLKTGQEYKDSLSKCFKDLLRQDKMVIREKAKEIIANTSDEHLTNRHLIPLLSRLSKKYPDDPGCFAIYLMNIVEMEKNEAIFLAANVPHAYLKGDCVEIMACSDNVVRAGLTPKPIDVETLVKMLDYSAKPAKSMIFPAKRENEFTVIFRPPVPDFALAKIQIPKHTKNYSLLPRTSGSIIIVIEGSGHTEGREISQGKVFFLAANKVFTINSVGEDFLIFQAMANV